MIFAALFTAVIAVLSQVAIPMPSGVPLTLQTFAIALCGYVLGWRLSLMSIIAYIILGAAGVPVFSSLRGGLYVLAGPTGGFIFGFLFMALLCGLTTFSHPAARCALGILGLILCHIAGTAQFSLVSGQGFVSSFLLVSAPYLVKDAASVLIAAGFGAKLKKQLSAVLRIPSAYNNK